MAYENGRVVSQKEPRVNGRAKQTCLHGEPYTEVRMTANGLTMELCAQCLENLATLYTPTSDTSPMEE